MSDIKTKIEVYFILYNTVSSLYNYYGSNYSNDYRVLIENLLNSINKL